ncbi:MAG: hypothetical protein K0Q95_2148 [Bacteroidota bacterium]|jgi:hypothetical protein|nr:hypothetical protein [Bacteroidota bacterium]
MKAIFIVNLFKLLLSRTTFYRVIKKSLFSVLLLLINYEIFVRHFGKPSLNINDATLFVTHYPERLIFGSLTFIAIFLMAYILEKAVLPFGMLFLGEYKLSSLRGGLKYAGKVVTRFAPREEIREAMNFLNNNKFDIYRYMAYLPSLLILASIWLSLHICPVFLLLIPLTVLFMRWFLKLFNTIIRAFK